MKLTQLQKELIRSYARADIRSPQQMLALLLAEGFRFLYFDKETIEPVGVTAKEAQHSIRIMGYIGQIMNSLAKGFYEAKALRYFQNLEHMIRECKKDSERSAKT